MRGLQPWFSRLIGGKNLLRLAGASAGSLVGFFILMMSVQLWFDVRWFRENDSDDLFGPGIIVISKKVTLVNTLGLSGNAFRDDEIGEIREKPFVSRVEPFEPCRFKVSVQVNLGGLEVPNMVSEFFFESIPDDLVDISDAEWHWDTASPFVPVVLPADFLRFYNFGFAPGQNLPRLSGKSLRLADLVITIKGNGQVVQYPGKIVGLSEKINAILVPHSFLQFSNNLYGDQKKSDPTRLVVVSYRAADPDLTTFIRKQGYETNQSELRSGRLNQLLQVSVLVTAIVGIVIVILALYLFILSFSLFIVRSDYEIRTLVHLGVPPFRVERYLLGMLTMVVVILYMVDSIMVGVAHHWIGNQLSDRGINIMDSPNLFTFLLSALLIAGMLLINQLNIRRNIRRVIK
ncbi:MAG TPA: hypothetical protein P5228_07860 [Bacteroidales bacterium]|nr:hypothetical protein [Bacteroidales bacterium]HRZ49957.1 hypothetical protein [Bacteroidales bacterium]